MNRKWGLLLALLFGPLIAQAAPLTWEDAVRLAVKQNPAFLSALESVLGREALSRAEVNQILPQIGLSSGYGESETDPNGQWGATADATLDIFNRSAYADIRSSNARRDAAVAELRTVSSQVRRDLRRAFVGLLFAQQQVDVSVRIRDLRKQNADLVSLKYDSGRESKGNMLKAAAEYQEALAAWRQAERAIPLAARELARRLGLREKVTGADGALIVETLPPLEGSEATLETHPKISSREAAFRESRAGLAGARASLWPTLTGRYARSFTGDNFFPEKRHWNLSGTLSFPLFAGGPTAAFNNIEAAQASVAGAELDLNAARLEVWTEVETAWTTLADRIDDVTVQDNFLSASRQRNVESSVRYNGGLMSYEDWERAVNDLVNYERSTIRALRDAAFARAEFDLALGRTLEVP